jgi:hypothetical protein
MQDTRDVRLEYPRPFSIRYGYGRLPKRNARSVYENVYPAEVIADAAADVLNGVTIVYVAPLQKRAPADAANGFTYLFEKLLTPADGHNICSVLS